MTNFREETDSMGKIKVPKNRLWGAQTQRSIKHFSIGDDFMPEELIYAFAVLKKASAFVNHKLGVLKKSQSDQIISVCNELLAGKHLDEFPLHVWMTGSGTQFNMNINEVIANRISQKTKNPLGSKKPIHPNDHVNHSQSSNDTFPTAMNIASALMINNELLPALKRLQRGIEVKAKAWKNIVKLGRTHMQDATPLTLGQEFSGYARLLADGIHHIQEDLHGVYELALGGTAVGTGINAPKGFDKQVAAQIAKLTKLPFVTAPNKFAVQGSHNSLVIVHGALKAVAVSLYKISNDIRLLSCGPRAGFYELIIASNEPGSSIMPGKVNPTQCEALCMVAAQVMANDVAISLGDAGGILEMNVYKPLIIYNLLQSAKILTDSCTNFEKYLISKMKPNRKKIKESLDQSLMLVTALSPMIGYDKASEIAHYAFKKNLSLKEAAIKLGHTTASEFDKVVRPIDMCYPKK